MCPQETNQQIVGRIKSKAISADTDSLKRGGLTRNRQKGLRTTILDCSESKLKKK